MTMGWRLDHPAFKKQLIMRAKKLYMDLRSYMDKKRIKSLIEAGYSKGKKIKFVQELNLNDDE